MQIAFSPKGWRPLQCWNTDPEPKVNGKVLSFNVEDPSEGSYVKSLSLDGRTLTVTMGTIRTSPYSMSCAVRDFARRFFVSLDERLGEFDSCVIEQARGSETPSQLDDLYSEYQPMDLKGMRLYDAQSRLDKLVQNSQWREKHLSKRRLVLYRRLKGKEAAGELEKAEKEILKLKKERAQSLKYSLEWREQLPRVDERERPGLKELWLKRTTEFEEGTHRLEWMGELHAMLQEQSQPREALQTRLNDLRLKSVKQRAITAQRKRALRKHIRYRNKFFSRMHEIGHLFEEIVPLEIKRLAGKRL